MRPISLCSPLVFLLMAGSATLTAQQAQPAASRQPVQTTTVPKASSGQNPNQTVTKHSARHRMSHARNGAKRPEYRPEFSENSVEVINGDATKKVLFHDDQTTGSAENLPGSNVPGPMKVEVVNGAHTDTQYLYNNGEDQRIEAELNRPVVVGIESSDTRIAGGNKHPVVMRVTASGAGDAKSESSGGQPVTRSISPRPKRPAYQPDEH